MKNLDSIASFNGFQEQIQSFKNEPKQYSFKIRSRLFRQLSNALKTSFIWLIVAVSLNLLGWYFFNFSDDKAASASLLALVSLFLTIAARNYTVNYILYHTLGNLGKNYLLHQLANHIGFLHRYMALSTLGWFLVHLSESDSQSPIAVALALLLLMIIVTALAVFRRRFHNVFESVHRYVGYLSVAVLAIYSIQTALQPGSTLQDYLLKPDFFLLIAIVVLLVIPWTGVRKIKPQLVHVGPHVIGMKLQGKPSYGTYSRITLANYCYHPFGDSMIDFDDMEHRTLYMTPAGDRTSEIVDAANSGEFLLPQCTIKKDRYRGFMYHHAVYDHVLIVVTGGGIAPIIPCLVLNKETKIDVLWIGRSQAEEFTSELLQKFLSKIEDQEIGIHILDTTQDDLKDFTNETYAALVLEAYQHYQPEAVFVMSNQEFTIDLLYALRQNKIKAYGAPFDS